MNTPSKTFTDLIVWQKAHQFVLAVYKYTAKFPKTENLDWYPNSEEPQFPFLQILRRDSRKKVDVTKHGL